MKCKLEMLLPNTFWLLNLETLTPACQSQMQIWSASSVTARYGSYA